MFRGGGVTTRALCIATFAGLIVFGTNTLGATELMPVLGNNSAYTLVDSADLANTNLSIDIGGETKYININNPVGYENMTYSWDENNVLTTDPTTTGIKPSTAYYGDYINTYTSGAATLMFWNKSTPEIKGNFIGNRFSRTDDGGTVYFHMSTAVRNIEGDFIGNKGVSGGAVHIQGWSGYTSSIIQSIKGDFIGNTASKSAGAISNTGAIYSLTGNFINNTAASDTGAIWNGYGISLITLNADNTNMLFRGNKAGEQPIAIRNAASTNHNGTINMNASVDNSITFDDAIVGFDAYGYDAEININRSDLVYNTVNQEGETVQKEIPYGGEYIFNNAVTGNNINLYNGAKVKLGTNTQRGKTYYGAINNTAANGIFSNDANGGLIDSINTHIDENKFGTITLNSALNLKIDVDINDTDSGADTYSSINSASSGIFNITGLNFINGSTDDIIDKNIKIQILKNAAGNNNLQLTIDPTIKSQTGSKVIGESETYIVEGLHSNVTWAENYNLKKTTTTYTGTLDTATTSTTNDSIGVKVTSVDTTTELGAIDTLKAINQFETTDDRTFTASNVNEIYTVTNDLGTTSAGSLTISGQQNDNTRSTLDFNQHKGFELDNGYTTLNLKDVEVKGASSLVSGSATDNVKVVLDNVNIHDNGTGIKTFGDVDIKGNSTISDDISVLGANSSVNVDGTNEVTFDGKITGSGSSALNLTNGTVNMTNNAKISAIDLTLHDVSLNLTNDSQITGLNTNFYGINTLNMANNSIGEIAFGNVNLNGLLKMSIDADLANRQIDRLTAANVTIAAGSAIQVEKINLISPTDELTMSLLFTDNPDLAKSVRYTGQNTIAYTPIYKYDTTYELFDNKGYFSFTRHGIGSKNSSNSFNPAVMAAPVAAQSAAQVGMNQVFNTSFEHADGFMPLPAIERTSRLRGNMYAINDVSTTEQLLKQNGLSTDFNDNMDLNSFTDLDHTNKALWVKPYTSFERINLHNGPKVDMISYGTLFGGDSDFRKLKNGWANVGTLYIGYNGAQIDYNDVSSTFNGGVIGITESFYKKNFFTAISANVGAGFTEAHTMYGKDDITMLMAGIASKTGYNFEFKEGKFIIQPSLLMSYSMINTFDYKNSAGVKIDSDPLHTIQLNPNVKFIANLKHEWQPYISVGMVYNLMNETKVTANNVKLPESSTKPYVEYGIGVQKHFGETFSGYGQAMVRNGGRNGITLTAGFRWALSDKNAKKDNKNVNKDDKNIKAQQKVVNKTCISEANTLQSKAAVKSISQNAKGRNLARYKELIGG